MSGLGRRVFDAGEFLTAANVNGYLMDQAVMVFASAAERSTEIPTPTAGMHSFRTDGTVTEVYNGSAWVSANSVGGTLTLNASSVVNTLTASTATAYTIASSDQSRVLQFTAAGTSTVTVGTASALTAGQRVDVVGDGAALIIAAGAGVTFAGAGTAGTAYSIAQYDAATILCVSSNAYRIIGNITAV
jgi:hypothetical protein